MQLQAYNSHAPHLCDSEYDNDKKYSVSNWLVSVCVMYIYYKYFLFLKNEFFYSVETDLLSILQCHFFFSWKRCSAVLIWKIHWNRKQIHIRGQRLNLLPSKGKWQDEIWRNVSYVKKALKTSSMPWLKFLWANFLSLDFIHDFAGGPSQLATVIATDWRAPRFN